MLDVTLPARFAMRFKRLSLDVTDCFQQVVDRQLATGGDVNAAEVLTAVQKADLSFRMMMQIRNKLVQAYQEIKEIRI